MDIIYDENILCYCKCAGKGTRAGDMADKQLDRD